MNIVERLAAKEGDIYLRRWWRPKTELKGELVLDLYSSGGRKHDSDECKKNLGLLQLDSCLRLYDLYAVNEG